MRPACLITLTTIALLSACQPPQPQATAPPLDLSPASAWLESHYQEHPYKGLIYQAVLTQDASLQVGLQVPDSVLARLEKESDAEVMQFNREACPTADAPVWGVLGDRGQLEIWLMHGQDIYNTVTCKKPS